MNGANPPPGNANGQHPGAPPNGAPPFNPAQPGPMGHPPGPMGPLPAPTAPPWVANFQTHAFPQQQFHPSGVDLNLIHTHLNCPMRAQDRLDFLDEFRFQHLRRFIPENVTIPPEDYPFLRANPGFGHRVKQLRNNRQLAIMALRQIMEDLEQITREEAQFAELRQIMQVGNPIWDYTRA